jgi:IclR family acetate operon transcriptional repressor
MLLDEMTGAPRDKDVERVRRNTGTGRASPSSVRRILSVLECLADTPAGASLSEIALAVGAPASSLLGLLKGLVEENYLLRAGRDYRLGPRSYSLGGRILAAPNVAVLARPILARLSAATGETSALSVLSDDRKQTVFAEVVAGSHPIRYVAAIGERNPLHIGAGGRMILSLLPPVEINRYIEELYGGASRRAAKTEKSRLQQILVDARAKLFTEAIDEATQGVALLAAPVFNAMGAPAGALLLVGPTDRFQRNHDILSSSLRMAADDLSGALGGHSTAGIAHM